MFGKSTLLEMKAVSAVSIISWVCLTFCSMFESGKFSRPDSADWKLLTLSLALSWENLQSSPYVHLFLIQWRQMLLLLLCGEDRDEGVKVLMVGWNFSISFSRQLILARAPRRSSCAVSNIGCNIACNSACTILFISFISLVCACNYFSTSFLTRSAKFTPLILGGILEL